MARGVTPIRSLATRIPEAGRIRIGTSVKATSRRGKEFDKPVKLEQFRFTSPDPEALRQVAGIYGGEVRPWEHQRAAAGQYELLTDATELRIALPPDPLGGTPLYELWEGGGCQRRCDGETCEMLAAGPDGPELQQVPCPCDAKGVLSCKVTTHLSVLLPEVRFVGVWRLTSHGWNAAQELPGMVGLIRSLQDRGIVRGLLRLEARRSVAAGETREFMVPVLGVDESVEALAAGTAQVGALGAPSVAALGAGDVVGGHGSAEEHAGSNGLGGEHGGPSTASPSPAGRPDTDTPGPRSADDDIIEAEIVDEGPDGNGQPFDLPPDDGVLTRLLAACDTPRAKNRALLAAREAALLAGRAAPSSFDEITDPTLAEAALEAIGC